MCVRISQNPLHQLNKYYTYSRTPRNKTQNNSSHTKSSSQIAAVLLTDSSGVVLTTRILFSSGKRNKVLPKISRVTVMAFLTFLKKFRAIIVPLRSWPYKPYTPTGTLNPKHLTVRARASLLELIQFNVALKALRFRAQVPTSCLGFRA